MARSKEADRKAACKRRTRGLLKKASELANSCRTELCTIVYSPFQSDPMAYSSGDTQKMIENFMALPEAEQYKIMKDHEKFFEQKINKLEHKLTTLRKENRIMGFQNMMYQMLSGTGLPQNMNPNDLTDLLYVLNQHSNEIEGRMEELSKEGPIGLEGANFKVPNVPCLLPPMAPPVVASLDPPVIHPMGPPVVPPMGPLMVSSQDPSMVHPRAPMVSSIGPSMVLQTSPLMVSSTGPSVVRPVDERMRYIVPYHDDLFPPGGVAFEDALVAFADGTPPNNNGEAGSSSNNS